MCRKKLCMVEKCAPSKTYLWNTKGKKLSYFGHFIKGEKYRILRLIMDGKIRKEEVNKSASKLMADGSTTMVWLHIYWVFPIGSSTVVIAMWIANLRNGDAVWRRKRSKLNRLLQVLLKDSLTPSQRSLDLLRLCEVFWRPYHDSAHLFRFFCHTGYCWDSFKQCYLIRLSLTQLDSA